MKPFFLISLLFSLLLSCASSGGPAFYADMQPLSAVPWFDVRSAQAQPQDSQFKSQPLRFAEPVSVQISPNDVGMWDSIEDGRLRWRLGIIAANARSLNLAFTDFFMPPDSQLRLLDQDGNPASPIYDARQNNEDRALWTAPVSSNALIIELKTPPERQAELRLLLTKVNVGYR